MIAVEPENSITDAEEDTEPRARVLLIDDHPMVRNGLLRLIGQKQDLVCCGEAGNAAEALAAVERLKPDLAILDLRLKNADGIDLIKTLKSLHPGLRILILSQYGAPLYVERALHAGAMGFVVKEQAADEVLEAIRTVLAGEVYLARGMAAMMLQKFVGSTPKIQRRSLEQLTDRELHVLHLLGTGLSTREIAKELKLSFKTIETHRENLKRKLGLRTAAQLVHYATDWTRGSTSPSAR